MGHAKPNSQRMYEKQESVLALVPSSRCWSDALVVSLVDSGGATRLYVRLLKILPCLCGSSCSRRLCFCQRDFFLHGRRVDALVVGLKGVVFR